MPRYRYIAELWVDAPSQDEADETVGGVLEDERLLNASFDSLGETKDRMHWEED
jgi:hypothetical protein